MRDTEKRNWAPVLSLLGAVVLLAADQATKRWALAALKPANAPMTIIDGLLEFFYVENRGMAFGLLQNKIWFVLPVTVVLSAVILILLFRYQSHSFLSYAAGALLLSGAVGNLLDRLFYGYVVDFIHVLFFPYIFNFADCCITVGAVLLVFHFLFFAEQKSPPPLRHAQGKAPEEKP